MDMEEEPRAVRFQLLANICHDGKVKAGEGTYKVHLMEKSTEQWYQIQDLHVEETIPQMIFLAESYIQVRSVRFEPPRLLG